MSKTIPFELLTPSDACNKIKDIGYDVDTKMEPNMFIFSMLLLLAREIEAIKNGIDNKKG